MDMIVLKASIIVTYIRRFGTGLSRTANTTMYVRKVLYIKSYKLSSKRQILESAKCTYYTSKLNDKAYKSKILGNGNKCIYVRTVGLLDEQLFVGNSLRDYFHNAFYYLI